MDIKYINKAKSDCCGCGACSEICPVIAIKFETDFLGFVYPKVDTQVCINCGACVRICPFEEGNKKAFVNEPAKEVYAAVLKDEQMLSNSASGGVFAGLAKYIIEHKGFVYGAIWNNSFSVQHIKIDAIDDLTKIQGSKYTQSDITQCFKEIREFLIGGHTILFSGTPCQVAALKAFLGKDYDSLFTVDLICHGVGSPAILKDDLMFFEKKYNDKLRAVKFRSKRKGWGTSGDLVFDNKIKDYSVTNSPYYYYYYLQNALFRDSCYNCHFATDHRHADLTIGDYWRIESAHPNIKIKTEKGISCILVNSDKGHRLLKLSLDNFELIPSTLDKIKERNGQLRECCKISLKREELINIYQQFGYDGLYRYYKENERKVIIKEKLKILVPNWLKKKLKKVKSLK